MIRLLNTLAITLGANAVGQAVAVAVLEDMTTDAASFVIAVLSIRGLTTSIAATVIVWLAALVAALLLPVIFVKNRVGGGETVPGQRR